MAQVGITCDFSGYTGSLIVVCKKASAPLVEVARSAALPFPVAQVVSFGNLSPETYIFEFWQSLDGTTLNTLIRLWSIDASQDSDPSVKTYEYIVDNGGTEGTPGNGDYWADPVQDDTEIVDERYAGVSKEDVKVEMRGIGPRRTDEWDLRTGGGIQLTTAGEVFNNGDSIFVTVFKKQSSPPAVSSSDYTDVVNVTADDTIDSTYKNKLVNCTSSLPVTTLTFPAFNTMADQKIKFTTAGMQGNYLTLVFTTMLFDGGKVHLTKGRTFEIMIKSGVPYELSNITDKGYDVRGKREFSDDVKPHQRLRDGTIYQVAEYSGIVEWIKTLPASSIIGTRASWNTDANRHKFYLNEGLGEFSFPDDRNMHVRALNAFDGSEVIGRYNPDTVKVATDVKGVKFTGTGTVAGGVDNITTPGHQFNLTEYYEIDTGTETQGKNVGLLAVINL